ncbi:MAG TPA: hypothetical protein VIF32_03290 [Gemmatimonadaceae bacterium]|jgi:hypothetical protein
MNALFEWLGVDRVQWRALVRASLRVDFAALRGAMGQTAAKQTTRDLSLSFILYLVSGASPAVIVAVASDVLFGATMMITIVGFMVMSTLLIGEGSTIVSPSDHHVLGFRPVTSRTYLAVRVTSIVIRTIVITSCVAFAPVMVYLFKDGFHPGRAVAALAAAYSVGLAVTLAIVAMYGWLLRSAGPRRMVRYASYVQFTAQMVTWVGFIVVSQSLGKRALAGLSLSGSVWALLYPGTWFGSYVALASGQVSWMTIVPGVLSMLLLVVLARAIGGKLSLGYAESLGRLTSVAAPQSPRAGAAARWMGVLSNETRAVAILVRSQLQHDMKFRMAVISLLPITFVYMYMGGWPSDPFVRQLERGGHSGFILIALLILPTTLRRVLVTSDAYRASWIFHTTPSDGAELVMSARNIITIFFLVPYLFCLAAIFTYSFHNPPHAILHTTFIGMVSYLVLQFTVMMNPQLPFSMPLNKETQAGMTFGLMIATMVVGLALYGLLTAVIYKSALAMVAAAAVFLAVAYTMDRVTRRRVSKRLANSYYAGE